ncbi:MAG: amidohydrolase family protein [Planctomycetaceae bacterium]|nr:amidohydrolase family protein [Planctomycetaceae bacterium]MCB9950086.1 amidohydrolase family protein [Planctomycetaceae bacterium]
MMDNTSQMSRRELLAVSAGAASALALAEEASAFAELEVPQKRIIDANVSLFRWPFRRFPLDETRLLAEKLQSLGVSEAWAGSFEGVFHRDVAGVNSRLVDECRKHPIFLPIGSVNLTLPGWETDLQRCLGQHNMVGVRVHPNYHGYTLEREAFAELLSIAAEAGRFVQIAVSMEDTRTQNELVPVADVDISPLVPLLKQHQKARVHLLNYRPQATFLEQIRELPGVYFDTARVDGTDSIPRLVEAAAPGRVLFGSHAPFLVPEAALIRTHESGLLDTHTLQDVLADNANRFREAESA